MRKRYLEEHRPGLYNRLVLSEKLQAHLPEIEDAARNRLEILLPKLAEAAGVTEELKSVDPLRWGRLISTCKAQAE